MSYEPETLQTLVAVAAGVVAAYGGWLFFGSYLGAGLAGFLAVVIVYGLQ